MTPNAPAFVQRRAGQARGRRGRRSAGERVSVDGTFPTAHGAVGEAQPRARHSRVGRGVCIQCGKCVAICPHATIRSKVYDAAELKNAPETFKSADARLPEWKGQKFTLQVAAEDCTGCGVCVDVCPAAQQDRGQAQGHQHAAAGAVARCRAGELGFLPGPAGTGPPQAQDHARCASSSCCGRCSSSPARAPVAARRPTSRCCRSCSATARSSPTPPAAPRSTAATCRPRRTRTNKGGRGPTWCNSLFEDNAEFGLGFRVSIDKQKEFAVELFKKLAPLLGDDLVSEIITRRSEATKPAFTINANAWRR